MLNQRTISKLKTYFMLLPDSEREGIIDSCEFNNRTQKRKWKSLKTYKDKVDKLFSDASTRKILSNIAYQYMINNIDINLNLDLNGTTYEEIILSVNDENKLYVCIFFFKWCYEHDGEEYFNKFIESDLFKNILKGETINSLSDTSNNNIENNTIEDKSVIETENNTTENKSIIETENINTTLENKSTFVDNTEVKVTEMENKLKLLGRIEKRTTFYNFFPQYEYKNGNWEEIPNTMEQYPANGGLNLSYDNYGKSKKFLYDEIFEDDNEKRYVGCAYILEIDKNDIEENIRDRDIYLLKVDLEKISDKENLNDVIYSADSENIYKVVTSEFSQISNDELLSKIVCLNEENLQVGQNVLLYANDKYYGPFNVQHRKIDDKFYIKTEAIRDKYIIPFYPSDSVKYIKIEKQPFNDNPYYTDFVQVTGNPISCDVIDDETLLKGIVDYNISFDLAIENPNEFINLCKKSPFFSDLSSTIIEERILRIKNIIESVEKFKEEKKKIFEALYDNYQDDGFIISESMIEKSEFYKKLKAQYKEELKKNEDSEKNYQKLKQEYEELKKTNDDLVSENQKKIDIITSEEYEKLNSEYKELLEKEGMLDDLNKLKVEKEYLQRRTKELEKEYAEQEDENEKQREKYEDCIKKLRNKIQDEINEAIDNPAGITFDPYLSSAMMKAAAKWDSGMEAENYSKCIRSISDTQPSQLHGRELIDFIVNYVKERREYTPNQIINIYINIAQNFLTIFSGEPGIGKTSMCNIIAETLGLGKFGTENSISRFVPVSVERGWTSKRDLIGYFNPLTRKYDKNNCKIYDALRILDGERENSKYPYLIMLDEANLSPIEYYWADFMRFTDRDSSSNSYINIGLEQEIYVPETLRFIATINTDQTTESLSPRLIDRASIIKLPDVSPKYEKNFKYNIDKPITWENFINAFTDSDEISGSTRNTLNEIYSLFKDNGMNVSPRIKRNIEKYISTAQKIMIEDSEALLWEKAVDYAIVQKLMPKINGYYSNYERLFDSLKQLCKEHHFIKTQNAIKDMMKAQERNMGYCQYLI